MGLKRWVTTVSVAGMSLLLLGCGAGHVGPTHPSVLETSVATAVAPVMHDLSGVVWELTPTGRAPVEGVSVDVFSCPASGCSSGSQISHQTVTDRDGLYKFSGLYSADTPDSYHSINIVWVSKAGFQDPFPLRPEASEGGEFVKIVGDTRFDVQLVRQ